MQYAIFLFIEVMRAVSSMQFTVRQTLEPISGLAYTVTHYLNINLFVKFTRLLHHYYLLTYQQHRHHTGAIVLTQLYR